MKNCEQMKDLSVLEHGISVARYYQDLKDHILHKKTLNYEWKIPEWIEDLRLWDSKIPLKDIYKYHIFHDCGKPFCINFDDEGRKHFPDHSNISFEISKLFFNDDISNLIKNDMAAHLTKPSEFKKFMALENYKVSLITGLCEIHSNAAMFGGIDSTSFKIKFKQINKLGKNILKSIEEE